MDKPLRRDHHTISGQLRFTGTRVAVDTLTDWLREGHGIDEFLESYPTVTREQVQETLSLMLTALQEGRRLDHQVVWCVTYHLPDQVHRLVSQIHMTRESAEAARTAMEEEFKQELGTWEVEDWLVLGELSGAGDERPELRRDQGAEKVPRSETKKSLFELWQYRRFIPDETHTCTAMEDAHRLRRQMEGHDTDDNPIEELLYGQAVAYVARRRSVWWAHNDEYSTPINFCPFCGERLASLAPKLIGRIDEEADRNEDLMDEWRQEIRRRSDEIRSGDVQLVPGEDVFRRVRTWLQPQ